MRSNKRQIQLNVQAIDGKTILAFSIENMPENRVTNKPQHK